MSIEEAKKRQPEYDWVLAKLPDGYIDAVFTNPEIEPTYISAEDGEAFDEDELEFIDDFYLRSKLSRLLDGFSKEEILECLNSI